MTRKREYSFDSKCYDLAEYFLEGDPDIKLDEYPQDIKDQLAHQIQYEIESWLIFDLPRMRMKVNNNGGK